MSASRVARLSIGLPAHNGATYLPQVIEGLLSQDYSDFELLISDDASTDATPDICHSYARLDHRVRVERQPTRLGITRNYEFLLNRTRGEFFMDAAQDDWRSPSYIRRCVAALDQKPEAVLALTDVRLVNKATREPTLHECSEDVASRDVVRRLRAVLRNGEWYGHYGVMRRTAANRTVLVSQLPTQPLPGVGPDWIVVELALLGPFVRLPEPLLEYHFRHDSGEESNEALANRLDPTAQFRGIWIWWWLKYLWRAGGRHRFDFATRLRIQAEVLDSFRTPGASVYDAHLRYNRESQRSAMQDRRRLHLALLRAEASLCHWSLKSLA